MTGGYDATEDRYLKPQKGIRTMLRMIRDIFMFKRYSAIFIISVVVTAVTGVLYPLALGYAVNEILRRNVDLLILYSMLFFFLYLIQFVSSRFQTVSSTVVAQKVIKGMRDNAFSKLQRVPIDFFSKVRTGYLISRIENDSESIADFLTYQLPQVISGITTILISAGIMFYLNARLAAFSLAVLPILGIFTLSLQGKVRMNYLRTRRTIASITGNLAETIAAMRTVKAFNAENQAAKRFDGLNYDNFEANMNASKLSSSYSAVIRVIEAAGIMIVIYEGSLSLRSGVISLGILVAFITYIQQFFNPIIQLSQLYNTYQNSLVGASRIYSIIDSQEEGDEGKEGIEHFSRSIAGKGIQVRYEESAALEGVSIEIRKGERVAIVGRTGAGKTTLTNVILKLKKPDSGQITIDLRDLRNINTGMYRNIISPVLQEPFLFNGTVFENIRYAREDVSREEVEELIRRYGMQYIFNSLPEGLDSQVGEMGRNMSEGQRQAVSIIRAFVRNPEIVILDEATAQIDPPSEKEIMDALKRYSSEGTLILISHRFSLITLADRIVVLDKGKVVQEGTLDSLSKQPGVFSELYSRSLGSE
ncbi:MAG: ABC transporter ATP-binding protein [Thermoplasmatales archaeon]